MPFVAWLAAITSASSRDAFAKEPNTKKEAAEEPDAQLHGIELMLRPALGSGASGPLAST